MCLRVANQNFLQAYKKCIKTCFGFENLGKQFFFYMYIVLEFLIFSIPTQKVKLASFPFTFIGTHHLQGLRFVDLASLMMIQWNFNVLSKILA